MLPRLRRWLSPDLAVDLGTANTLIAVPGSGVLLDEPSVVALQHGTRQILGRGAAVGKIARQMLGRTPDSITAVRPIRDGVITDFELCEAMLRFFFRKIHRRVPGIRQQVVVAVPGQITPVEKRAVFNSFERAGAGRVYLVSQAKAAAIGAGLPISEPLANLVCDIGSGSTEVALLSLSEIVASHSVRVAGESLDAAIVEYLRRHYSLKIGVQQAEQVKLRLASAALQEQETSTEVRGLDLVSGIPRKATVTSEEIREAILRPLEQILDAVQTVIEQCNPELVADLADTGLTVTGGGAQLPGLDRFFEERLGIPVRIAPDPQRAVIRGTTICVEHLRHWKAGLESLDSRL